jgi:DNA-damage-inducible protein J
MPKTAMIRARTNQALKEEAEHVFHELGLNQTQAINLFYRQVVLHHGLPFEVKIPNATTKAAIDAARRGDGQRHEKLGEVFADLEI